MRPRLAALAFAVALTAAGAPARADTHAEAVKAFEEGRKLREANELDKAKLAFERSISIEPSIGATYNLALIHEQQRRPREAVDAYRQAEKLAHEKGDPREKDAAEARARVLEAHHHVVLQIAQDVASAPGLKVVLDGEVVPAEQLGGEVFRPPSSHELLVVATGRKDLRTRAHDRQVIQVVLGEPATGAAEGSPPPAAPGEPGGGWGWQKWTGAGLIGVGVVGVAISVIRVLDYISDESRLDEERRAAVENCSGSKGVIDRCDGSPGSGRIPRANDALRAYDQNEQDAKDGAPLTVAAGVVGLLLVGGGVALFATAPSSATTPSSSSAARAGPRMRLVPHIGPRGSGLVVVGAF